MGEWCVMGGEAVLGRIEKKKHQNVVSMGEYGVMRGECGGQCRLSGSRADDITIGTTDSWHTNQDKVDISCVLFRANTKVVNLRSR